MFASRKSIKLLSAVIRNPATREPYERKLLGFLKRISMSSDAFLQFAKRNPPAAEERSGITKLTNM
jgi:hypothetical protein